jgi:hypothetical protein
LGNEFEPAGDRSGRQVNFHRRLPSAFEYHPDPARYHSRISRKSTLPEKKRFDLLSPFMLTVGYPDLREQDRDFEPFGGVGDLFTLAGKRAKGGISFIPRGNPREEN